MSGFFSKLGRGVGINPGRTLILALIGCLIGMSGFSVIENESRGDKLWLPTGTRAQDDWASYIQYFGREGREEHVITVPSDGGNVLTKENLVRAMDLFTGISEITIAYEGSDYSFEDLCVQSNEYTGTPCKVQSVLGMWEYDSSILAADTSVLDTINANANGQALELLLGNPTTSEDGEVIAAEALRFFFLLKNTETVVGGEYVDPIPDAWEEEFIIVTQECVDEMDCFVEAARSLNDEFSEAISGDISLISGSYLLIMVYATINLSGRPLLRSRILLSLGALLTVGLSIAFSIGLASYLGYFYTPLHTVLPFILLGLGIDDSFVICNAFGRTDPRDSIPERMAVGLGTSGVSITVTSITDFVAFMISSVTVLPALASFCVYSGLGILALYVLQSTIFTAFVVYDARRQEAARLDCCPCFKTKALDKVPSTATTNKIGAEQPWNPDEADKGRLGRFVSNIYAPFVVNKVVKLIIITGFLALLGVCAYGTSQLEVSDTADSFIPDGSYLLDTNNAVDRYFGGVGAPVEIVTEDIDYFEQQAELADIADRLSGFGDSNSPYIQEPATSGTFFSWFNALVEYAEAEGSAGLVASGEYTVFEDETEFYSTLQVFLASEDGAAYNSTVSVVEGADGSLSKIEAAAIQSQYSGSINGEAAKQVDAMVDLRDIVDSWEFEAFPWSTSYLEWETFRIIYKELVQGLGLCLAAVLVITLILIAHPGTAMLVFICVTMTIIDVLGVMYYWDLTIDTVAVINLVLAVGLAVDYAAHVAHSFMIKAGTKDERVVQALADIGVAVIHGGVSTFLAVVLLSASSSYVFRVMFKQFFSTAILGLGHGLVLLPVLLSLVGPASYSSAEAKKPSSVVVNEVHNGAAVAHSGT